MHLLFLSFESSEAISLFIRSQIEFAHWLMVLDPHSCEDLRCDWLADVQAGAFRIGDTAGTLDNIVACRLHRPGSVGFVSKSGGMSNEMYNVLSRTTDGLYEGRPSGFAGCPDFVTVRWNQMRSKYEAAQASKCLHSMQLPLAVSGTIIDHDMLESNRT